MRAASNAQKNIAPAIVCTAPWRLTYAKALNDYRLEVEFTDGLKGYVEMKALIMCKKAGIFALLKDVNVFERVFLECGVVTWPNEIDLAPDAMHNEIKRHGVWILK